VWQKGAGWVLAVRSCESRRDTIQRPGDFGGIERGEENGMHRRAFYPAAIPKHPAETRKAKMKRERFSHPAVEWPISPAMSGRRSGRGTGAEAARWVQMGRPKFAKPVEAI